MVFWQKMSWILFRSVNWIQNQKWIELSTTNCDRNRTDDSFQPWRLNMGCFNGTAYKQGRRRFPQGEAGPTPGFLLNLERSMVDRRRRWEDRICSAENPFRKSKALIVSTVMSFPAALICCGCWFRPCWRTRFVALLPLRYPKKIKLWLCPLLSPDEDDDNDDDDASHCDIFYEDSIKQHKAVTC